MSKVIFVYAQAVGKCVHLRVTDAWYKQLKMAKAIGVPLDGYPITGVRVKRKNQEDKSHNHCDDEFKGHAVVLNKHGVWEFKEYKPKVLTGVTSGRWQGSPTSPQQLPRGYNPTQVIKDDLC